MNWSSDDAVHSVICLSSDVFAFGHFHRRHFHSLLFAVHPSVIFLITSMVAVIDAQCSNCETFNIVLAKILYRSDSLSKGHVFSFLREDKEKNYKIYTNVYIL